MVDGAYHLIYEQLCRACAENDIVANVNHSFSTSTVPMTSKPSTPSSGSVAIRILNTSPIACCGRAIRRSSTSCSPSWGYRTCYYRTFNVGRAHRSQHDAYKKEREWLDMAIALIKPGVSTDRVCGVWPKAEEFGFPDEMSAFGLQFGHGLGLALHERPIISRVISMTHPTAIKEGMVFALEKPIVWRPTATYRPH